MHIYARYAYRMYDSSYAVQKNKTRYFFRQETYYLRKKYIFIYYTQNYTLSV